MVALTFNMSEWKQYCSFIMSLRSQFRCNNYYITSNLNDDTYNLWGHTEQADFQILATEDLVTRIETTVITQKRACASVR